MEKSDPDFKTPVSIRNLFTHHDTHPVVLDLALMKAFEMDWLTWEPETIWTEVQRVFESQISEHNRAKVQTVRTLHVVHTPWMVWQVFEKVIQGLNNNIPRFDMMQAPTLDQLYAGIDIMDTIRRESFSDEVKGYMAAAVLNEDVFFVPPPLDFIQVEVSRPYYECLDCGNSDSALFHDGVCDTCVQKYDGGSLSMRGDQDLIDAGKGKNLKLHLQYNPDLTQTLWESVKHSKTEDVQLDETMAGAQVAKLLVARDYMNVRRRQLAEQLVSLKSWLGAT